MKRLSVLLSVAFAMTLLSTQAGAVAPARYQATGTTLSHIDDGTSLRFNPAGLGYVEGGSFSVSFSPIFGGLHASIIANTNIPRDEVADRQLDSEPIFGPGFMLSSAYRVTDWMTLGLSIYPVIAGGADYRYVEQEGATEPIIQDFTKKLHAEIAPGFSINLPKDMIGGQYLSLGVAYRIGYGALTRLKGDPTDPKTINIEATGMDFSAFTIGLQYKPIPELQLGLVYRSRAKIDLKGDVGLVTVSDFEVKGDVTSDIVSPAMVGLGLRANVGAFSVMVDLEYVFNSQVDTTITKIQNVPQPNILAPKGFFDLYATFKWTDSINVRTGFELRFDNTWAVMAGVTWLENAVNRTYPTAFGAPAGDNLIGSLGVRYDAGDWEMNLAYTNRMSEATIVEDDLVEQELCSTCQFAGDYALTLQGVHLDFSTDF